jgi:N-methylhydantoinase B
MMMTSPEMKNRFVAQGGCSQWPGVTTSGIDQRGNQFGGFMLDPMGGSIGAFAFRDGIDTGGLWFDSKGFMPNVEHNEHTMPILYLYRKVVPTREEQDSTAVVTPHNGHSYLIRWIGWYKPRRLVVVRSRPPTGCRW